MGTCKYEVLKIFNNNVILSKHNHKEKIVIKKGIGFNKKPGDFIHDDGTFDKIFVLENKETSHKFMELITRIDDSLIGICEEILYMISSEMNSSLDEEVHIRLIDHIAFTLYRIKNNDKIENPFIVEIETLYPREMHIAEKAVRMLENKSGLSIPEGEIGFIALHIHSAINKGKLSNTIKYAYICSSVIELIEDELGMEIERNSLDYARFVCHIRFALQRVLNNIPIKNDLLQSIKKTYKNSYTLAKKAAKLIEGEIYKNISDEEVGYITIHIERLKNVP